MTAVTRPRWLIAGGVVVLAGVLLAAQNSTVLFPAFESYRLVDARTIAITVDVAPCSWTRVTGVVPSPSALAVNVETLPCPLPLPGTDALDRRELLVPLTDDLGQRAITDAEGQPIRRQPAGP